jgi:hypothetical protein
LARSTKETKPKPLYVVGQGFIDWVHLVDFVFDLFVLIDLICFVWLMDVECMAVR